MTSFRHTVGKSTLKEGVTVPKAMEPHINAPSRGEKRSITLLFEDRSINAVLRRLANAREHVQIKYETKDAQPFRDWLNSTFNNVDGDMSGDYLEVERIGQDVFRIHAFPTNRQTKDHLQISEWVFHRTDMHALQQLPAVRELPAIIQSIEFRKNEGQAFYNQRMAKSFADWHWQSECQVIPELPLKCDFRKDGVPVEVEFGNARTYYQDYIKFVLGVQEKVARVGVLVVPTEKFAQVLCSVGRQRAIAKGRSSYSGMIQIEKVKRELPFLSSILRVPLAIAGIDVYGQRQEWSSLLGNASVN